MVKAIFFDIDGTLLSFETREIPESTKKALTELKEKGIKLFIATGRPKHNMKIIDDMWTFDGYVNMNGQYCVVDDKVVWANAINKDDLRSMNEHIIEKNIICDYIVEGATYLNKMDHRLANVGGSIGEFLKGIEVKPFEEFYDVPVFQVGPFITTEEEIEFLKCAPHCKAARWHDMFADIIPKDGGKNIGIDKIIEMLGIDITETMAFGDGGNDISMLEHVGIGVAMGNARDEVKAVSDYVTDCVDQDGIYNALKHFKIL